MELDLIRSLFAYNRWANQRLLAQARMLPPALARQRFGASFDSVHGTLAHILAGEVIWLSRWRGQGRPRLLAAEDFQHLAELEDHWQRQDREMEAFLAGLTSGQLQSIVRYTNSRGESREHPLWQTMLHVVNHGTHHRSELADMLTRAGYPPPATDLIVYFHEALPGRDL